VLCSVLCVRRVCRELYVSKVWEELSCVRSDVFPVCGAALLAECPPESQVMFFVLSGVQVFYSSCQSYWFQVLEKLGVS
jgi:hypothetical protein